MISPQTLAALRAAVERMTLGPWRTDGGCGMYVQHGEVAIADLEVSEHARHDRQRANAEGIALLRNHAASLIAAAERVERLEAIIRTAVGYLPGDQAHDHDCAYNDQPDGYESDDRCDCGWPALRGALLPDDGGDLAPPGYFSKLQDALARAPKLDESGSDVDLPEIDDGGEL